MTFGKMPLEAESMPLPRHLSPTHPLTNGSQPEAVLDVTTMGISGAETRPTV